MLSHIYVGVGDLWRAETFYGPILRAIGALLRFQEVERGWLGWQPATGVRPLFIVGLPENGAPASVGNGQMVALLAPDRAAVDRCHALAMAGGGSDEGGPGLRPHYHPHYYGAYFRDPDGNKICVCCHDPVAEG